MKVECQVKKIVIGERLVDVDRWEFIADKIEILDGGQLTFLNAKIVPILKVTCETTRHVDGRQDVNIYIPCLDIQAGVQEGV